jgi:hypothetical protein
MSGSEGTSKKAGFSCRKFEKCGACLFRGVRALNILCSLNAWNAESRKMDESTPKSR